MPTPSARKQAAREYQRAHGVSYTAALRAVAVHAAVDRDEDLRAKAFLDALGIDAVDEFDPTEGWGRRAGDPALRVPVGVLVDRPDEVVSAEFSAEYAVWAVAGAACTGKSVALEGLALAMCALYPPSRVTLACLDLKGATFSRVVDLPHVVCSRQRDQRDPAIIDATDFYAAVNAELDRRAAMQGERLAAEPDFIVLIDAFDELSLFDTEALAVYSRLVTDGPPLGVRVVVASMRHEVYGDGPAPLRADAVVVFRLHSAASSVAFLGGPEATTLPLREQAYVRGAAISGPVRMFYAPPVASGLSRRIRGR